MSVALPPPDGKDAFSSFQRLRQTPLRDLLRGRLTGRLDWQRKLAASGLPPAAQVRIFETVKRTKLWRLEKAEVCDELMAHFEDGILAGESAEALARDFGDVKRTAKLIRRAKKKLRPLWWQGWKWSLRGLAALVVVYAGLTMYYMNDKVTIKTDYLAQLNAVALNTPESERAWPMYREGMKKWREIWNDSETQDADGNPLSPQPLGWLFEEAANGNLAEGSPDWQRLTDNLQAHEKELTLFRQAAGMPHMGFVAQLGTAEDDYVLYDIPEEYAKNHQPPKPYRAGVSLSPAEAFDNSLLHVLLPYLGLTRSRVVFPLIVDLRNAVVRHDSARITANMQALWGISKQSQDHGIVIEELMAISNSYRADSALGQAMGRHPDAFNAPLLSDLAKLAAQHEILPINFDGEELMVRDFIQHTYTDDGHGDGHFTSAFLRNVASMMGGDTQDKQLIVFSSPWFRAPISLLAASRRDISEKSSAHFALLRQEAHTPRWQLSSLKSNEVVANEFIRRRNAPWDPFTIRYKPLAVIFPILGGTVDLTARTAATHSALQLGIAFHRHKLTHGAFPAQLSDLVPAYLKELPVDPITGGPLHYRLDAKGNPLVWSVGADHVDDGGYAPVNREGEEDNRHAQQWLAPEDFGTAAKGDWILWPMADLPVITQKPVR